MAVQQNKKSPSKRGMHRSHNALAKPGIAIEPTTGEPHRPGQRGGSGGVHRQAGVGQYVVRPGAAKRRNARVPAIRQPGVRGSAQRFRPARRGTREIPSGIRLGQASALVFTTLRPR